MKHLSQIQRMEQIIQVVEVRARWYRAIAHKKAGAGFTMIEIGHWIHMQPSGHLRGLLSACVVAGWLSTQTEPYRTGVDKTTYQITALGEECAAEYRRDGYPF